ncbi:MAG: siphovirus Gp157 family protein [Clostridia bacterium]|nr:siphovirus Gp157 family protein [Clostridia bacterium]
MSIYNISANYRALFDTFDNAEDLTDEEIEAYFDTLEGIEDEFDIKVENIACYIKSLNGDVDLIDKEIEALKRRKQVKENLITRLKKMLVENMQRIKKTKIDRPRAKLTLKNNAEQAHFTDETAFLNWAKEQHKDRFINTSIKQTLSKTAVKNALQNGEKLPGAWLEKSVSVIIK